MSSALVQGPIGLLEKAPCGDVEVRLTVTGCVSGRVTPAICSRTDSGADAVPADSVAGAFAIATEGVSHVARSCHPRLNDAPAIAFVHDVAHAVAGSWIAAASWSRTAPLSVANCVTLTPSGRLGCQAKPKCVPAEPRAYGRADTSSSKI